MPASMMSAETGFKLNVIGSSIAMLRRDRVQVERDRQQHRDGGDRADAGKHSDQRAEQHADERVQQVERADRYAEAEDEVVEEIHARLSRTRMRPGTSGKAASGPSRRPGTRRGSG